MEAAAQEEMTAEEYRRLKKKGNKYGAHPVTDIESGVTFDSTAEYKRYDSLRLLEKGGAICGLLIHVIYPFVINGILVCQYESDFVYMSDGVLVVEDVKSKATRTPAYSIKRKLMKAVYGIRITEVDSRNV